MAKQARSPFAPVDQVIHTSWQDPVRGLAALPAGYFDHFIFDPPYCEHVHEKKWSGSGDKGKPGEKKVTFDPLGEKELRDVADEVVRLSKGWALTFCADDDIAAWREAYRVAGAMRWAGCIWTKPNGTPQFRGEGPSQPCEHIVAAWCGEGRPQWNGGGKMGHYDVAIEPKGIRRHETQKPVRLMTNLVLDFTRPGDLIADPYAGAGTLGYAARRCGRRFVLWERDLKHAAAAEQWIAPVKEQLRLERTLHAARPAAFGDPPPADPRHVQERIDYGTA
jgi:hypothetical protein